MRYYANPCTNSVRDAMRQHQLGFIATPAQGQTPEPGFDWCADNGCFSNKWNPDTWWQWITGLPPTMRFVVCPDVVADAHETTTMFHEYAPRLEHQQLPIAYVAQDGVTSSMIPWDTITALFIGGTTQWKLSEHATNLVAEANTRNTWVHMGRVNSYKRLRWSDTIGCDSADGTYLTYGPDKNLPKLLEWLDRINTQPVML